MLPQPSFPAQQLKHTLSHTPLLPKYLYFAYISQQPPTLALFYLFIFCYFSESDLLFFSQALCRHLTCVQLSSWKTVCINIDITVQQPVSEG